MKIRNLCIGLILFCVALEAKAQAPTYSNSNFIHPGCWQTETDLERIRKNLADGMEPLKSAWEAFKNTEAGVEYKTNLVADETNAYHIQNDGHAAWVLTIKWVASGKKEFADAAIDIINSWVNTVKTAPNTTMRNGLGANQMANAAEILAWGFKGSSGWRTKDIDKAKIWFKDVIYARTKNGASANWGTSCMAGNMSMAVFCDDKEMFDAAVASYKYGFVVMGSLKDGCSGVTQYIDATGENAESGRDQAHSQGGIAHLVEVALVAWNQGVNLVSYNDNNGVLNYGVSGANRLHTGLEYTAKYNTGNDVAYHPFFEYCNNVTKYPNGISAISRGYFSPIWEMAAYLFTKAGLTSIYTHEIINTTGYRPEKTNSDHPGLGTLLFSTPGKYK